MLFAARVDAGHDLRAAVPSDLTGIVAGAVARWRPRAELDSARISVQPHDEAATVLADPAHIDRILDNLLANALNCSGANPSVTIAVEVDDEACIRVTDNGIGVPPEMRERIFERFVRVDGTPGRVAGTGLGLHISRQLAELDSGRLVLERSEPGAGSTFTLVLPRLVDPDAPAGIGPSPRRSPER